VVALIATIFATWWPPGCDDLNNGVANPNSGGGGETEKKIKKSWVNSGLTRKVRIVS